MRYFLFFLILSLPTTVLARPVETSTSEYWVTEDGGRTGAGTRQDPYSVSDFNAISSVDTSNGDVIFYFSGTVTSKVAPQMSGSQTGYVILDGYQDGDCDHLSGTADTNAALLQGSDTGHSQGIYLKDNAYLIIQDLRITKHAQGICKSASSADDTLLHTIIRRVATFDCSDKGIFITASNYTYVSASYLTIEECLILDTAEGNTNSSCVGITLCTAEDTVIRNSLIYNNPDIELVANGQDGIAIINCHRVLVENCTIHHVSEDGIDIKNDNNDPDPHGDHILRYLTIYDTLQSGITVQHGEGDPDKPNRDGKNVYIYGCMIHGGTDQQIQWDCILIQRGFERVAIWSNIFYDGNKGGISVRNQDKGEYVDNVVVYNNTIVNNRVKDTHYQNTGIAFWNRHEGYYEAKNNILADNACNNTNRNQVLSSRAGGKLRDS